MGLLNSKFAYTLNKIQEIIQVWLDWFERLKLGLGLKGFELF